MAHEQILIVEDDPHVSQGLSYGLRLCGYQVQCCESAEAALSRLNQSQVDLVISDFRLPGVNGLELLEQVGDVSPHTRRILITAFGSGHVEKQARACSDAYLPKPFSTQELVSAVQAVLGPSGTGQNSP